MEPGSRGAAEPGTIMSGFAVGVLRRLQLLRGVLAIWRSIAADGELEEVFGGSRGRSYEKTLTFAELVRLFADAIAHHAGSGRQAMLRAKEEGRLSVSQQAAYGKLRRVPPEVSQKLVEHCTLRMREMVPESMEPTLPASLRGYAGVTMDGKTLKELAKRLLATRQAKGGLLGGRVLAALDMRTNQIVCIQADQDGYANEAPLLEPLLPRVRELIPGPRLYVLDRQFGFIDYLRQLSEAEQDAYVVRCRPGSDFEPGAGAAQPSGTDGGGTFTDRRGHLRTATDALAVRMILLKRPGEEDVQLVTNLLDQDKYPAQDLLDVYLQRWEIERVFQQIVEVFGLERLIGSTPQAAIFQFALCVLWYNVIQIVKHYLAIGGKVPVTRVSGEQVFTDIRRQMVALDELTGLHGLTRDNQRALCPKKVRRHLMNTIPKLWTQRWLKSPPRKKTPASAKKKAKKRPRDHSSAARLIEKYESNPRKRSRP